MTTWKAGDVTKVAGMLAMFTGGQRRSERWVFADGSSAPDDAVPAPSPLVVIDPESADDVERLADAFCHARWSHIEGSDECDPLTRSSMRAALREFAAPTPPTCPTLALQTKNAECSFDPGHDGWHTDTGMGVSWA